MDSATGQTAAPALSTSTTPDPAIVMAHMLASKALQPPLGADTKMTLDSPEQVWFLVVAILCIAIPGLFLIVRIYTKLTVVRMFDIADYFILVSFPLIVLEIIFGYYAVKWGSGVHQWQISFSQLFKQLYWLNVAEIIYCPLSFLVKMAIILQYLRLFAPSRRESRLMWYGAWLMIGTCFIFYVFFAFWTAFYCYPRKMIWDKFSGGKCHDHSPIVMWQGTFNMASDIVILLLPTTSLWQLNVPLARKIVITMLFGTGLLACAASAMRVVFTVRVGNVFRRSDVSHNGFYIGLWTVVEVALGFVVACSLSLPRLVQAKGHKVAQIVSSSFSTLRSKGTDSSPGGTLNSYFEKGGLDATMERSLGSQKVPRVAMRELNGSTKSESMQIGQQPMTYEEHGFHHAQKQRTLNVIPESPRDSYRLPTPSASSQYSSKRSSCEHERDSRGRAESFSHSHQTIAPSTNFSGTPGAAPPQSSYHASQYTAATEPWNSDPWSISTTDLHNMPVRQNSASLRKPLASASTINPRISRGPSQLDRNRVYSLASEPDSTSVTDHNTSPVEPNNQEGEILLARSYSYSKHTRRLTEIMTIEQIEMEMERIQQFRFEEVKQSLDRAREGSRSREM